MERKHVKKKNAEKCLRNGYESKLKKTHEAGKVKWQKSSGEVVLAQTHMMR